MIITQTWRKMVWFTAQALAFANRHWMKRLSSKRSWWTNSIFKGFLCLKRSMPLLTIFSTLLGWGGLRLMWPWDNAQWDLELTYPMTELLAFFTALCVFDTHESWESPPFVPMYLEKTFVPSSLEIHLLARECGIWFSVNSILRITKVSLMGALFSFKVSLLGAVSESSFFISSSSSKPLTLLLNSLQLLCFMRIEKTKACSHSDDGWFVHSFSAFRYLCDRPRVTEI